MIRTMSENENRVYLLFCLFQEVLRVIQHYDMTPPSVVTLNRLCKVIDNERDVFQHLHYMQVVPEDHIYVTRLYSTILCYIMTRYVTP